MAANLRQFHLYSTHLHVTCCLKSTYSPRLHLYQTSRAFHNHLSTSCYTADSSRCKSLWQLRRNEPHSACKSLAKCPKFHIHYQGYSQDSASKVHVTLDNIFSSSNKKRLQDHLLTTVKSRSTNKKSSPSAKLGHAAVLVPLCMVEGEPSVLFTLRSTSLRKHRGQVSFPGGMMDETDQDVVHTALRETQEELGIAMETVDVWGTMMDIPTRDENLVTPVLGYCGEMDISKLILSEDEVELVFTRTIKSLCDPRNTGHTQFRSGYTMPVYLGGEHRIWGLTSFILHQTLTHLAPGLYHYKLKYRS